ncbi:hypothetical protein HDU97_000446 [Phlyctochytrium planicorne]|nr:hypothetical protein HDU97_000446 [Phlyctochytrium planicorne]
MIFTRLAVIATLAASVVADQGAYYAPPPPASSVAPVSTKTAEYVPSSVAPVPTKGPKKCIRYKKKGSDDVISVDKDGVATVDVKGGLNNDNPQLIGDGTFTPTDPAPVDPAPVDPAPVDPAPVDPAPVDPAPVDPRPSNPDPKPSRPSKDTFCKTLVDTAMIYVDRNDRGSLVEQVNAIRSAYTSMMGGSLPTVSYNLDAEANVKKYTNSIASRGCPQTHSSDAERGPYGENLNQVGEGQKHSDIFYHIKANIDYAKECDDLYRLMDAGLGPVTESYHFYGHLSQLLWSTTTGFGCSICSNDHSTVSFCHYTQGGNVYGRNVFNQ